jgi:hypothetical protein
MIKFAAVCTVFYLFAMTGSSQESVSPPLTLIGNKKVASSTGSRPASEMGQMASDMLPGNGTRGGYILRNAPVLEGSESVYADGKHLVRDRGYWIDYASGTLSFAEPIKRFSTITVSYRYNPSAARSDPTGALPVIALSFGQTGTLQTMMYRGQSEKAQDGSVWQTNAYGLKNALQFGQGNLLQGYFFVSTRKQLQAFDAPYSANARSPQSTRELQERFMVQNLQLNQGAIKFGLNYQDIGSGFSVAQLLKNQQGISPEQLTQWEKEKGIKRVGYNVGLNFGQGATLEHNVSQIKDGKGSVESRSLQFSSKSLNLYWNRREAGTTFARFNDLAENERGDWAREKGMIRTNQGGQLALGFGQLKADMRQIDDRQGKILLQNWRFESPLIKFNRQWQRIEQGFTRFGDLGEGEKGQWARERGITRDSWDMQMTPKNLQLVAQQSTIDAGAGRFHRQRFRAEGKNWCAEHLQRSVDSDFNRLQDLAPQEHVQMAMETRQFYDPNTKQVNDQERAQSLQERGLERTFQRAEVTTAKDTKVEFKRVEIQNKAGEGGVQRQLWSFTSPVLQLQFSDHSISQAFGRIQDLAPIERNLFANERGMRRIEWSGGLAFKQFGVAVSQTNVHSVDAGLQKASYRLFSPRFEMTYNTRSVDPNFTRTQDLADPERNLLTQLRGFNQSDWSFRWNAWRGLVVENFQFNANNPTDNISNQRRRTRLQWQLSPQFQLSNQQDRVASINPSATLWSDEYERSDAQYKMRFGQFDAYREARQIGGTLAQPLYQQTEYWKFQSQNIKNLAFTYESRQTDAEGAISEDFRNYLIQYQLNNRFKLNLSEARADREGAPDEVLRQVGLEYMLMPGATLSFSEGRKLTENSNGSRVLSVGLTQTAWGFLSFGGTYQEWRVDRVNTKAQSGFIVQTAKPIQFLFLSNLEFTYNYGSLVDQKAWHQENKRLQVKANWNKQALEAAYIGVYVPGKGRAIDRLYRLVGDPNPANHLQYNLMYKVRTYQDGTQQMIRQYNASYKISDKFSLVHEFQTLPEQANPQVVLGSIIQPTGFSNWALNWVWNSRLTLRGDYRLEWNDQQARRVRRGGLTFIGTSPSQINFSFGYRIDSESFGDQKRTGHTFSVGYDRKLSADYFFVIGFDWTHFEKRMPQDGKRDQQRMTLELKRVF